MVQRNKHFRKDKVDNIENSGISPIFLVLFTFLFWILIGMMTNQMNTNSSDLVSVILDLLFKRAVFILINTNISIPLIPISLTLIISFKGNKG